MMEHTKSRYKFKIYIGDDLMNLPIAENYLVFEWMEGDARILYSITQQGKGINVHFASNRPGLRYLKEVSKDFTRFVFEKFTWCRMMFALVQMSVAEKIAKYCGFRFMMIKKVEDEYIKVFVLMR